MDANVDGLRDLLVGRADGTVKLYINVHDNDDPQFDGGTLLQVGDPGFKTDIDVGSRATPLILDWDNDFNRDLLVGAADGRLHIFINEGTDSSPDYRTVQYAQDGGSDLVVPALRSSPHVDYLDDDYNKDVLMGDTEGQILLYSNTGTDEAPVFSGYAFVDADGVPINLAGLARSRPYVCDWNNDGLSDLLVGADDGRIHLYKGIDPTGFISEERPPPAPVAHLLDLHPNPFNPSVTVPFVLLEPLHVTITVYNATGRRVVLLADRFCREGEHNVIWTGVDDQAREVSSGVYFIRLNAGGTSSSRRAVLLR